MPATGIRPPQRDSGLGSKDSYAGWDRFRTVERLMTFLLPLLPKDIQSTTDSPRKFADMASAIAVDGAPSCVACFECYLPPKVGSDFVYLLRKCSRHSSSWHCYQDFRYKYAGNTVSRKPLHGPSEHKQLAFRPTKTVWAVLQLSFHRPDSVTGTRKLGRFPVLTTKTQGGQIVR
ncbi:hypothetical protein K402DRAFT_184234 [Aulographum hederae CBS 113979]|uniref:Uncharacterized protein n=1 Tax=Aulographum hederae CBS 113979 TaxID=1176131 RepID=A0A6G1GQA1_9PEZI|nr:hypothetical protein K402DRAFT_184234 [Aulographum hederae CBS 113979]